MQTDTIAPPTAERVPRHSPQKANEKILEQMLRDVACWSARVEDIDRRLRDLERPWDIERTLEANAATVSLAGLALAAIHSRRWLLLPAVVSAFLLQHAVQGWCPPLSLFRRLGVRTQREIDRERYALKAIRGDFRDVPSAGKSDPHTRADAAIEAAR